MKNYYKDSLINELGEETGTKIYNQLPQQFFINYLCQASAKLKYDPDAFENVAKDQSAFLAKQVEDGQLTPLGKYYVFGKKLPEAKVINKEINSPTKPKVLQKHKQRGEHEIDFL